MAFFTNQATLRVGDTVTNSNITVGELIEALTVTKTAVTDTYTQDGDITYVVNLVNTGSAGFEALTVTDDLGGYTVGTDTVYPLTASAGAVRYFVNGVLQPAPDVTVGPPLVIGGISVPAGGNAAIVYEARTTAFAPPADDGAIVNEVTVTGGGLLTPVTDTETVRAAVAPLLTVTKSLSPLTVSENGTVTYTFTIRNTGNTPIVATDDAVLTDLFDPVLSGLTATYNGVPLAEGEGYTYDETTGLFTTAPGQITVPAATFMQDPATGEWVTVPGTATLVVSGTV